MKTPSFTPPPLKLSLCAKNLLVTLFLTILFESNTYSQCPDFVKISTCNDYADVNGTQNDSTIEQMTYSIDTICCDSIRKLKVIVCGRTAATTDFMLSLTVIRPNELGNSSVFKKYHYNTLDEPILSNTLYYDTFCFIPNPNDTFMVLTGGITQKTYQGIPGLWPTDDQLINKTDHSNTNYCFILTGDHNYTSGNNSYNGYGIKIECTICMMPGVPCSSPGPESLGCYCE